MRPSISRSISSPSSPAPPTSGCTRQASWSSPTRTRRARSSRPRRRSATRTACRPTKSRTMPGRAPSRRHNLVYWRYGEYVGVGPGAHGRLVTASGRVATATERHPETWLDRVERAGHGSSRTPADPRRGGRRVPAYGPAPARRRRSRALPGADRSLPGREAHPGARSRWPHRAARTGGSPSRRRGFRCWTPWWRISRRKRRPFEIKAMVSAPDPDQKGINCSCGPCTSTR